MQIKRRHFHFLLPNKGNKIRRSMQHPLLNTQSTTPVASAAYHHTYASVAKLRAPAEAVGSDNAGVDPAADVVVLVVG
jgi:hypothetical protein